MPLKRFRIPSLTTRVTVLVLVIFVLGILALAVSLSSLMHQELEQQLGQQQRQVVAMAAQEIDQEMGDRLHALEQYASQMRVEQLPNNPALQHDLEQNFMLHRMFNGGTFVVDAQGTTVASVPDSVKRLGDNYMGREHIANALRLGKTSIGDAVIGRHTQVPVVSVAVPVRNPQGIVTGALVGAIDIGKTDFLNYVVDSAYGKTGGYLVVDKQHRRVVMATDKRRILEPSPPPGLYPHIDRYLNGYEDTAMFVNPMGVEVLQSNKSLTSVPWFVVVQLPTREAFAPIHAMQQRIIFFAALLTMLVATVVWWVLRRQFAPLKSAVSTLSHAGELTQFPSDLTIVRHDEVGQLMVAFNDLLESLRQRELALSDSELRYRTLVEWTPQAFLVFGDGTVVYANPEALRLFGAQSASELVGRAVIDLIHPEFRALAAERIKRAIDDHVLNPAVEAKFVKVDGTLIDVITQSRSITYGAREAVQVAIQDITERKSKDRHLRQLSQAVEQAPIAVVITDLQGNIEYANPAFTAITGYLQEEVVGGNPRILQSGRTPGQTFMALWKTLAAGKVWQGELFNRKKNGEEFVEYAVIAPVLDEAGAASHYVAIKQDITDRQQAQQQLQDSLQEKIALLHEVHHRVKNNLQVITSLLRMELRRTDDARTSSVLEDMKGRVHAMALLHETLYRAGNFATVDLAGYLRQLATQLFRIQAGQGLGVQLLLELVPCTVTMDQATTCGLLVNELMSNALKHGFPNGAGGTVTLRCTAASQAGEMTLEVQDNGAGLPGDFEQRRSQSLGLLLSSDMARQLGSELQIGSASGAGARFVVTFPLQDLPAAAA
jgi:PAS domain S-box-containing protein